MELLFFSYRDFIGEPDAILDDYDFGRAHHRVIHFV
ncbi:MAG TPA: MarR family transcriptional regulator, partial [Rhodospirillales bacterium]|nr:MarR family transcriptional regulator [Rhodospirillales bacterium]